MTYSKFLSDVTKRRLNDDTAPSQQVGDPSSTGTGSPIETNPTTLGCKCQGTCKKCTNEVNEKTPPDMEELALKLKPEFKERYGDKWEERLYATLWKMYKDRNG